MVADIFRRVLASNYAKFDADRLKGLEVYREHIQTDRHSVLYEYIYKLSNVRLSQ